MKLLVSTRGPCWAVAGQDRHFASQPHGVELNHPCGLTVDGTSPSASMCPSPSRVRLRQRTAPSRSEDALIRGGHPGTRCMTRLTVTGNECRRRVLLAWYRFPKIILWKTIPITRSHHEEVATHRDPDMRPSGAACWRYLYQRVRPSDYQVKPCDGPEKSQSLGDPSTKDDGILESRGLYHQWIAKGEDRILSVNFTQFVDLAVPVVQVPLQDQRCKNRGNRGNGAMNVPDSEKNTWAHLLWLLMTFELWSFMLRVHRVFENGVAGSAQPGLERSRLTVQGCPTIVDFTSLVFLYLSYRKIARQVSTPDSAPAGLGSPQAGIGGLQQHQQQPQQQTQQTLHQADPMQQSKDNLNPAANQQTGALRNGNPPPPVVSMAKDLDLDHCGSLLQFVFALQGNTLVILSLPGIGLRSTKERRLSVDVGP
ncbi:hypothetical protein WN48_06366 [Eufriesea mexicana]|uniref:Uncharacterized protein n=1 Tax=Eufriesea mexicana TaxID=516756 RepID=A0A310SGW0_9HYME|nr:hypothetical protein WN48_06366 [Eufriesea mexicana]